MNAFAERHAGSIRFGYSCFDRMLLNAVIQVLQSPASIVWFLREHRGVPRLSREYFRCVSVEYHQWVEELSGRWRVPIVTPPKGVRRDEWVEGFYHRRRGEPGVAVILKCRENARVCVNGHEWLALRMRAEGIRFRQCGNAFLTCSDPERLQQLSDALSPHDLWNTVLRWLSILIPFFTDRERRSGSWGHRLFVSQAEYGTNLIFHRRASLDGIMERLLDLNRTIGRPDSLSVIFGKRITKRSIAGLKTQITDRGFAHPTIRSHDKRGSIKQYVRDHLLLRTEVTSDHTPDLGVNTSVEHLPQLRSVMKPVNERYLDVQQDVLETYVDRGELERLREPTVSEGGRRTPGLKLDDPRLLALMQALVRFAPLASGGLFRTKDLHGHAAAAQRKTTEAYTLSQLRYDLGKLRTKGLVQKVAGTQSDRLTPGGDRLCVLFLKLFHKIYAPLTSATLSSLPSPSSASPPPPIETLYAAVDHALHDLCSHIGLKLAA